MRTTATLNAFFFNKTNPGLQANGFRIMAPQTTQVASLEEDYRADSRPICSREGLDIIYFSRCHYPLTPAEAIPWMMYFCKNKKMNKGGTMATEAMANIRG